jgi:hypothetical protein
MIYYVVHKYTKEIIFKGKFRECNFYLNSHKLSGKVTVVAETALEAYINESYK